MPLTHIFTHVCILQRPAYTHKYSKRRYTAIFALIDTPAQSYSYAHTQKQVCTYSHSHFHTFRLTVTHICIYIDTLTLPHTGICAFAHIHTHTYISTHAHPSGPPHMATSAHTHAHVCLCTFHWPHFSRAPRLLFSSPFHSAPAPPPHLPLVSSCAVTSVRVIVPHRVCLSALVTRACSQTPAYQHARMSV